MPVEIKELIIRASVRVTPDREASDRTGARDTNTSAATQANASQEEKIVSRCVEQVMDILRIQNER